MKRNLKCFIGALPFLAASYCYAEIVPFDSERWDFEEDQARVEAHLGEQSLYLKGGIATIIDSEFTNGIIEYDIAIEQRFSKERAFVGAIFRLQDSGNYEKFYMRSHRSEGEPDATHFVPVYNHWSSWQLFWDKHIASVQFAYDEWMHVKVIISGRYAEVYVIDMEDPALVVELKREIQSGKVGVKVDTASPAWAHYANFDYTPLDSPPLLENQPEPQEAPAGTVMSWLISEPFEKENLDGILNLNEGSRQEVEPWTEFASDPSTGVGNLAKVHEIDADPRDNKPGPDTVFARTTIVSETEQLKKLQFGYSDKVKLYFNGQLLYSENNAFRSRDYRFMGLMRYANELYLPLKAGENELWMAVTGLFASWGVQARLEDMEGIEFNTTGGIDLDNPGDDCLASYSMNGNLHIPCVSVPIPDVFGGVIVFDVEMNQQPPLFDYVFKLDPTSIQIKY
jgi:hypothetical protein